MITSALTLGQTETGTPVAMFTVVELPSITQGQPLASYHVGVDIVARRLRSFVLLGEKPKLGSAAQSPIVMNSRGQPVVVLSTFADGVLGIGAR